MIAFENLLVQSYPDGVEAHAVFLALQSRSKTLLCEVRTGLQKVLDQSELDTLHIETYEADQQSAVADEQYRQTEYVALHHYITLLEYMEAKSSALLTGEASA